VFHFFFINNAAGIASLLHRLRGFLMAISKAKAAKLGMTTRGAAGEGRPV